MPRIPLALPGALLSVFLVSAHAQSPVHIGVITSLSGVAAQSGEQMKAGIGAWLSMHGSSVAGRKLELIDKDDTGPQADVAKRLATELISRDRAKYKGSGSLEEAASFSC